MGARMGAVPGLHTRNRPQQSAPVRMVTYTHSVNGAVATGLPCRQAEQLACTQGSSSSSMGIQTCQMQ